MSVWMYMCMVPCNGPMSYLVSLSNVHLAISLWNCKAFFHNILDSTKCEKRMTRSDFLVLKIAVRNNPAKLSLHAVYYCSNIYCEEKLIIRVAYDHQLNLSAWPACITFLQKLFCKTIILPANYFGEPFTVNGVTRNILKFYANYQTPYCHCWPFASVMNLLVHCSFSCFVRKSILIYSFIQSLMYL